MKNQIEIVSKIVKPREIKTAKGYLYSFSVPIAEMDGDAQLTEWLSCSIFLKEQNSLILTHKEEFHFIGKFSIKKAYKDYPQGLQLFGFEITPVFGKVYRVPKPKQPTEDATQAPNTPGGVSPQAQSVSDGYTSDFPIQDSKIPF